MSKLGSQQDYWNSRANEWGKYDAPLIPGQQDIDFMRKHLVPRGDALILGATPELCSVALDVSKAVTSIDFAEKIIEKLCIHGAHYKCVDWFEFFKQSNQQFDNIMTDGGLLCLEFPGLWQRMAEQIYTHLKPGGIFTARVYISTDQPPKDSYKNPNLARFINSMADVDENWMLRPGHKDYKKFEMRYALPPEHEVLRRFDKYTLVDKLVPDYEAGEYFVSYALQRP